MRLEFIPLNKLVVSKANMRYGKRAPDVSDILATVRKRGVIQPVIVRPNPFSVNVEAAEGALDVAGSSAAEAGRGFEIIAGSRRFHAARIVAHERVAGGGEADPLPCAILDDGDDADAVEASLIENLARLDPDEVTQWATFTRLVKEGRTPDDIAATFGLPELTVKRVLALGNLLPRIRAMYSRDDIDVVTVRHLTLASKRQQHDWLALVDEPEQRAPTGSQLKAWLFGGQSIPVSVALFDPDTSGIATVADLFGEHGYFADASAFWTAQNAAIEARRASYLADGWGEAIVISPTECFQTWKYEKASKRKGGRVYIDVRSTGEVTFHEGYVSRREAERAARGSTELDPKPVRAEITAAAQTYVDLHRHAAVRAALAGHSGVALRLMVAHVIVGSPLWAVRREPQAARDDATRESVENCLGEAAFDERRRAVLAVLDMDPERATVTGGSGDDYDLVRLFLRLLDLPDAALGDVIAVAMGETLIAGGAAIEAVGLVLGIEMAAWWQTDTAFLDLVRDKEVLGAMVADVAGTTVAAANAREKGATLKRIIADHLTGAGGRPRVERWVPRWLAFPPSAYTPRGGVGTVGASARLAAARLDLAGDPDPDPASPPALAASPDPDDNGLDEGDAAIADDDERLAA